MASECFSTRLYPKEAAFIQQIMDDLQITKHQIMAIFLDTYQHRDEESPDWTCADYVKIFMQPLRDRISTQQAEIDSLKAQISQLKQQQEKQLTNREKLSRRGMRHFLNFFEPNDSKEIAEVRNSINRLVFTIEATNNYLPREILTIVKLMEDIFIGENELLKTIREDSCVENMIDY